MDKTTCDWRITKSPEAVCFFIYAVTLTSVQ